MLALYLAALGFGITVLAASAFLGGKDVDHGPGGDGEVGAHDDVADHVGEHGLERADLVRVGAASSHLLSVRFWTFGLAAFGATGTLATLFDAAWTVVFAAALLTGAGVGFGASAFFRSLQGETVSGETTLSDFVGEEGRVLLPIRPGGRGTIRVTRQSGTVELVATTRDASPIPVGAEVLVTSVKDGVADVTASRPTDERARQAAARSAQTS